MPDTKKSCRDSLWNFMDKTQNAPKYRIQCEFGIENVTKTERITFLSVVTKVTKPNVGQTLELACPNGLTH